MGRHLREWMRKKKSAHDSRHEKRRNLNEKMSGCVCCDWNIAPKQIDKFTVKLKKKCWLFRSRLKCNLIKNCRLFSLHNAYGKLQNNLLSVIWKQREHELAKGKWTSIQFENYIYFSCLSERFFRVLSISMSTVWLAVSRAALVSSCTVKLAGD